MKNIIGTLVIAVTLFAPATTLAVYVQNQSQNYTIGYTSNSGIFSSAGGGGFGLGGSSCITGSIGCVAGTILYIINYVLVPVLFALSFVVFLYGVARTYIFSHGETEEISKGHKLILYGLIGFVVMVSLWGLVNVVANTFGLQGAGAPPTPTSISNY